MGGADGIAARRVIAHVEGSAAGRQHRPQRPLVDEGVALVEPVVVPRRHRGARESDRVRPILFFC